MMTYDKLVRIPRIVDLHLSKHVPNFLQGGKLCARRFVFVAEEWLAAKGLPPIPDEESIPDSPSLSPKKDGS